MVDRVTELITRVPDVGAHAGVVDIALATSQSQAREATHVLAEIWSQNGLPLTPELVWAMLHAGNYVAVARHDDRVIGAAVGFRGYDEGGPHLHSHIAGVLPAYQGSNIGFALKQHQRTWALATGIHRITWTFDPLVARNVYFNVMKLGATVGHYYEDFYGPLDDSINAGDESDRCLATWQLDSDRATGAAAGNAHAVTLDEVRATGAAVVLTAGAAGEPVLSENGHQGTALALCELPADIVALRSAAPLVARQWRLALRSVLGPRLRAGAEISAVTRDGWLVIGQPETVAR